MCLFKASGLGKTKSCFPIKKENHAEVCQKIEEVFPPSSTCGGYTLLKARTGRICKPLEKLEIKWFNFEDIEKWIIGTSCIYIKPIQRNLDLETSHALLIQTPNWPKKPRSVHKKFSNIATLVGHNSGTTHWNSFIITASIIIESKNFWVYGHFKHFLKCLKGTFYCLKCLKGTFCYPTK